MAQYVQDERTGRLYEIVGGQAVPIPPLPPVPSPSDSKEISRFWLAAALIVSAMVLGLMPAAFPALAQSNTWLTAIIANGATNAIFYYFGSKKGP